MAGIDIKLIQNSIPEDRKIKGLQKLGILLIQKGSELESQSLAPLQNIIGSLSSGVCPAPQDLQNIIQKRNNIIDKLNKTGDYLDLITNTYTGVSLFLDALLGSISIIKGTQVASSLAAKFLPTTPGLVTSLLTDLGTVVDRLTFSQLGNSKLQQVKDSLDSVIIPISLVSNYITQIVEVLNQLDILITPCLDPNNLNQLDKISSTIQNIVQVQKEAELASANQLINQDSSYKGFVFQIEEIPFSSTVTRRKAVAFNQSGIKVLETELSFTANGQTLINELKLIIESNNLKAY